MRRYLVWLMTLVLAMPPAAMDAADGASAPLASSSQANHLPLTEAIAEALRANPGLNSTASPATRHSELSP